MFFLKFKTTLSLWQRSIKYKSFSSTSMSKIYSVIVDVAHVESSFKNKKKQMRIDIQEGCMDETSLIMLLTSDALLPNASFA